MVSVCATCKGLQLHLRSLDGTFQDSSSSSLIWVNTTLPNLRRSTIVGGCRACALILQGILLHHDRFAGVKEDIIRIKAESFTTSDGNHQNSNQGHLSVEVRWKDVHLPQEDGDHGDEDDHMDDSDRHDHDEGYPDLKLEYFTDHADQGTFPTFRLQQCRPP